MADIEQDVEDCGHDHEGGPDAKVARISPWWSWNDGEVYTADQFREAIVGWKMTLPTISWLSGSIVGCLGERQHGPILSVAMRGVRRFGSCHCDERHRTRQMLTNGARGIGPRIAAGVSQ